MKPDYVASSPSPLDRNIKRDHARKGGEVMPAATSGEESGQGARSTVVASVGPGTQRGQVEAETPKPAPSYDRNEAHRVYMRDYMRKRRAADKAARSEK